MVKEPKIMEVYAKDLNLSKTNPRFARKVESEEEAILTFFHLKSVGPRKIEAIIQDILDTKSVLEDFIVLNEDGKFTVYDGNRRLTALKLFIDDNAEIIKEEFPDTYRFIKNVKKEFDISELPLLAKVYEDKEKMAHHVLRIHGGTQGGEGQINWGPNEKNTFMSQFFDKPLNIGNQIYKKLESSKQKQKLYNMIKDEGYSSTFDRIFNFADIKNRIFHLKRGEKVDVDNNIHFEKVCEMIELFLSKNANVTNVYLKDDAVKFFESIDPIYENGQDSNVNNNTEDSTTNDTASTGTGDQNKGNASTNGSSSSDRNTDDQDNDDSSIISRDSSDGRKGGQNKGNTEDKNNESSERRRGGGRPRKEPKEYDKLLNAYPFKNKYRNNIRINGLINELRKIEYKEFGLSTNFLIRSLLETYAYEYTNTFNNLDKKHPDRLKGLTLKNFSDKDLREKYFDYIAHHIGKIEDEKYSTIKSQIIAYFDKNNNVSVTQKLNHYIHIPDFQPNFLENLQIWEVVFKILEAMDELIVKYSGQNK